jgi:hypothetical protein
VSGRKKASKSQPPPIPALPVLDGVSLSLELATASITGTGTLLPLCVERIDTLELHNFPRRTVSRYTHEILRSATRSRIEVRGAPDTRGTFFTVVSYTVILFCLGTFSYPSLKKVFSSPAPTINVAQAQAVPNVPVETLPVVDVSNLHQRTTKKGSRKVTRKSATAKTQNSIASKSRQSKPNKDMGDGFFSNTID